jgi:hypothetical protein
MQDSYYSRPEVSNSDLSALKKYFYPDYNPFDPTEAYRFGNLVDAMCTEPEKVNYFKRTITDYEMPFTKEDFELAEGMKQAFRKDELMKQLLPLCSFQKVFTGLVNFNYGGFEFSLNMRCKFDFFMQVLSWGGDLKSTAATSQKQFHDAFLHFDYDRSRVLYMLLSGAQKDIVVGVSKKNFQVFKIAITPKCELWNSGLEKLTDLAFKYWMLFENIDINKAA